MRMSPLLADFIYNRVCKLKCEKFLTRPAAPLRWYRLDLKRSLFYDALLVDEKAAADDAHGSLLAELLLLPDSVGLDRL